MRKILAAVLSMMLLASLIVLPAAAESAVTLETIKLGFIHVSDPSDMGSTTMTSAPRPCRRNWG